MSRSVARVWITTVCFSVYALVGFGCSGGGGGGGGVTNAPPANVAGSWQITMTNAGQAVFTGCTGDLTVLDGLTVAGVLAASGVICNANYPAATQSGQAFTLFQAPYSCTDGSTQTAGGGGTVSGNTLRGQFDTVSNLGYTASEFFNGSINGNSLTLSETRVSYGGFPAGACNLSPPVNLSGMIVRGSPSRVSPSREGASPGQIGAAIKRVLAKN